MNQNMNRITDYRKGLIGITVMVVLAIGIFFLYSAKKETMGTPPVYGVYRIYSDDPAIRLYIQDQNTYLKINTDQTIVYNTTINGKPKFSFEGTFTQKNNELAIQWKDGKLPSSLTVEKKGDDQIIKIGSTIYKKEKTRS
jgi:hypothetical protein